MVVLGQLCSYIFIMVKFFVVIFFFCLQMVNLCGVLFVIFNRSELFLQVGLYIVYEGLFNWCILMILDIIFDIFVGVQNWFFDFFEFCVKWCIRYLQVFLRMLLFLVWLFLKFSVGFLKMVIRLERCFIFFLLLFSFLLLLKLVNIIEFFKLLVVKSGMRIFLLMWLLILGWFLRFIIFLKVVF